MFTKKPYSKAVERNEVCVSIITSSHATSHDVSDVKINHGPLQCDCHDSNDAVQLFVIKLRVNVFLVQF